MNKALSIWHLHDVYSLDEAAWLIAGESPNGDHYDDEPFNVYSGVLIALKKTVHDFSGTGLKGTVGEATVKECLNDPFSSEPEIFQCELSLNELANVTVTKLDLIQWLDHKKHYPPFFFPEKSGETTPKEPKEATPKKEPTYTTPRLAILNDAIDYFWVGVDPKSKHAPTNDNVKDWILEAFEKKGLKQSGNIAAAMATIIRHPDKP